MKQHVSSRACSLFSATSAGPNVQGKEQGSGETQAAGFRGGCAKQCLPAQTLNEAARARDWSLGAAADDSSTKVPQLKRSTDTEDRFCKAAWKVQGLAWVLRHEARSWDMHMQPN